MKNPVAMLLASTACLCACAAEIDEVIVRQQWPWSTDVKVEYKITGVTEPVDISVAAYNGAVPLSSASLASAMSGDLYGISKSGTGTITIDPVKAFGDGVATEIADFRVVLTPSASSATTTNILYKIVHLDAPYEVEDVRRADFLNGKYTGYVTSFSAIDPALTTPLDDQFIWTGVTNDVKYKTDYLVLRRIPAAGKTYKMHSGSSPVDGGNGVDVTFSKDFYIGVFELTQSQALKFGVARHGSATYWGNAFYHTNTLYAATRPADTAKFASYLRGNTDGKEWPAGDHTTLDQSQGDVNPLFFYDIQQKTGLLFDLPTQAMWEYACRAGVVGHRLYSSSSISSAKIARFNVPNSDRNAGLEAGTMPVGSYLPNAYGLYDMLGNVAEVCLNVYLDVNKWMTNSEHVFGNDPRGTADTTSTYPQRAMCGGSYADSGNLTVNWFAAHSVLSGNTHAGVRLALYLDNNPDGTK